MEPLDPKAELMRLVGDLVDAETDVAIAGDPSDAFLQELCRIVARKQSNLSAAITLALADARRQMVLDLWHSLPDHESIGSLRYTLEHGEFAADIRKLVDGKAGGT